jgi:hypothetical protein
MDLNLHCIHISCDSSLLTARLQAFISSVYCVSSMMKSSWCIDVYVLSYMENYVSKLPSTVYTYMNSLSNALGDSDDEYTTLWNFTLFQIVLAMPCKIYRGTGNSTPAVCQSMCDLSVRTQWTNASIFCWPHLLNDAPNYTDAWFSMWHQLDHPDPEHQWYLPFIVNIHLPWCIIAIF